MEACTRVIDSTALGIGGVHVTNLTIDIILWPFLEDNRRNRACWKYFDLYQTESPSLCWMYIVDVLPVSKPTRYDRSISDFGNYLLESYHRNSM